MDPQAKELSVLLRHVPRIVVSHFLKNPERLREPVSSSFTAVVALFDISGFSSLGSKLSDDERDQIKAITTGGASKQDNNDDDDNHDHNTVPARPNSVLGYSQHRTSLPIGLSSGRSGDSLASEPGAKTNATTASSPRHRTGSLRYNSRDLPSVGPTQPAAAHNAPEHSDRSDSVPRNLMRQRRQSSQATSSTMGVTSSRTVSFVSRAKPAAPQGIAVETLTTTLNKTLEPVIDMILQHGGDIIKFAGDALIVIWETESSQGLVTPQGALVHSALRCAMEALRVLHTTSQRHGHTSILGMHVGIGVSQMTGNHVGGVLDRWEFYLSGDANRQMSGAEQDAGKGEVVLSKEAYRELMDVQQNVSVQVDVDETLRGNFLVHHVSRSSTYQPKPPSMPKASLELVPFLRGYVPGTISSYLRKGLSINPCTRNITAVFVKLEGVSELPDGREQLQHIHKSLCLIQESAYKVQGTLRQFVIDDKGAVAIIAIGLPPFYHENNALRGIKLANYLLDKGLRASIGVTTGNAFCGSVGSNARAEYAVVGDVINLAARLMSSAGPSEILCDEITQSDSKDSVQYDDAQEIIVKGKTTKVRVFRVQRQDQVKTKLDVTTLLEPVHGLPYGSEYLVESVPLYGSASSRPDRRGNLHRVLVVTGESGTGKSMLLRHFQHNQSRSFMGSGDPVDSAMDFHAWAGIIKEMISRTIKTPKHLQQNQQLSQYSNVVESLDNKQVETGAVVGDGPSDTELLAGNDDYLNTFLRQNTSSRKGLDDGQAPGSRVFPLKTHLLSRLHTMETGGEIRSASSSSTGRNSPGTGTSPTRLLDSLTNSYEHVPLMEYLILKQRISRSMVPILNDLLPHNEHCQGSLDTLEKGEERTKALELLMFCIVDAISAHKPILLIFDNAQWMDAMSWSLLVKVLDELPHVNALIATRTMHRMKRQPVYEMLEQLPYVKKQEMRRFTYQVTSLFLCQQYHIAIMDTQVLDFVFTRTDGNPAELIKLMDFMIHSQYISIDPGSGSVSILLDLDDLDMQVPQYTRAKVMSCVDTLDGLAQMALKVISVHPEPVEERMLHGILTLLLTSPDQDDDSETEGGLSSTKFKLPRSSSAMSILHQVRVGLAECEREAIVTLDDQNKLIFFNSDEMRLVVYNTMLPSQREMIHFLYCQWFRDTSRPARAGSISFVASGSGASVPIGPRPSMTQVDLQLLPSTQQQRLRLQQQFAMLGFHLSRSGNAKPALEAYQKAAEHALENKDLSFATDCMQSSFKILDEGPRVNKLNDLDYILLRSTIEFLRGAIAIEKSEWDVAIMHMSYIIRLCQRKGSVLRRYSSSIYRNESVLDSTKTLAGKSSSIQGSVRLGSPTTAVGIVVAPSTTAMAMPQLRLQLDYMQAQQRCLPKLFNFQRLIPSGYPASMFLSLRRSMGGGWSGSARRPSNRNPISSLTRGHSGLGPHRVQPEETLLALNKVHFYKKKAEVLIKKINISKRKQEEMSREIQRLTQKSIKTKTKR